MPPRHQSRGSTLAEVVVSVAMLAIVLAPVAGVYLQSAVIQAEAGHYLQALNVGRGELEKVQAAGFVNTVSTVTTYTVAAPAGTVDWPVSNYSVTKGLYQRTGRTGLMDVVVAVAWTERKGTKAITLQSSIANRLP